MIVEVEDAPRFAVHWAGQLGASVRSLERLRGGINNRVFRCGDGKQHWVIKGYASDQPGNRDRMQAEVDFLRFAAQVASGFTPELIHVDSERRCVVLEYLKGKAFLEGIPPPKQAVEAAVEFFRQLNVDPEAARKAISLDAAEGFLSLSEHINNINQRLNSMSCDHIPGEARFEAKRLITILYSDLNRISEAILLRVSKGELVDVISPEARCVSPSDFGFHNAILCSTGTKFIDFEFAGWDDPSKATLDFIIQPRIPINFQQSPLLASLSESSRNEIQHRSQALKPLLSLKWVCIILAILNPDRLSKITSLDCNQKFSSFIDQRIITAKRYMAYG